MSANEKTPGMLIARLDRIPVWSLPGLFVGIIGVGFLFTFYDIFDINVSFIQTCTQIVPELHTSFGGKLYRPAGSPESRGLRYRHLGPEPAGRPCWSSGFVAGDTMVITGLGSMLTAVVDNYTWFVVARTITGIGIGADLAIVNTYINEMAPRQGRARYTSLIFLFSALGAVLGIWLGLWLTTPATPLPLGLPFAVAGPGFAYGWRIMYLIGGLLALVGVLLRFQLPEIGPLAHCSRPARRGRHSHRHDGAPCLGQDLIATGRAACRCSRRRFRDDALFGDTRRSDVSRARPRALCHVVLSPTLRSIPLALDSRRYSPR